MGLFDLNDTKELGVFKRESTGKRKVLIDFSHLSHRNIFVAQSKIVYNKAQIIQDVSKYKEIIKGDIDKSAIVTDMYFHLMLNSIVALKKKFKISSEDIYICIDSYSWRKDFYKEYKAHRAKAKKDSDLDWSLFYGVQNELLGILSNTTKINCIGVKYAEADDIIFTLARKFSNEGYETIVSTSDKDLKQCMMYKNVRMWDPMKQEEVSGFTEKQLMHHILIGDSSDNIPSIKDGCEFTDQFITFLKTKNIFLQDVYEVTKLEIFNSIKDEFIKSLKLKDCDEFQKLYKPGRFAEKTADKLMLQPNGGFNEIFSHEVIKRNFFRNRKLIDMRKIPYFVKQSIIDTFDDMNFEKKNDMFSLQDWMVLHKLKQIQKDISFLLT